MRSSSRAAETARDLTLRELETRKLVCGIHDAYESALRIRSG